MTWYLVSVHYLIIVQIWSIWTSFFLFKKNEEKHTYFSYLREFLLRSDGSFLQNLKGRIHPFHQAREHKHISTEDIPKNLSLDSMWFKKSKMYRNDQLKKISPSINCQVFIYSLLWMNVQTNRTRKYKQLWKKLINMPKCSNLWLLLLLFLNNCKDREILALIWMKTLLKELQKWVATPRLAITLFKKFYNC